MGDGSAVPILVAELAPVVRVAIARTLVRAGDPREEGALAADIEATAREVFAALFEDGARLLRLWNERGEPSLRPFVRSVAARIAVSIVKTGKRAAFTFEPLPDPPVLDGRPLDDLPPPDAVQDAYAALAADDADDEASWEARLRGTLDPEGASDLAWRAEEDPRAAALYAVTLPRAAELDAEILLRATAAYDSLAATAMSSARTPQRWPSRFPSRHPSARPGEPPASNAYPMTRAPEMPLAKRALFVVVPLIVAVAALVYVRLSGGPQPLPGYHVAIAVRGGAASGDALTVAPHTVVMVRALPDGPVPPGVRGAAFARCGTAPYRALPVTADDTNVAVEGEARALLGGEGGQECTVVLVALGKDAATPESVDAAYAANGNVRVVTARVSVLPSP